MRARLLQVHVRQACGGGEFAGIAAVQFCFQRVDERRAAPYSQQKGAS